MFNALQHLLHRHFSVIINTINYTTKMSRASIEQALIGLIPALNGPLPPELVELAVSLLARSRSVASSLKSDEEIARPYACAQLACERHVLTSTIMRLVTN